MAGRIAGLTGLLNIDPITVSLPNIVSLLNTVIVRREAGGRVKAGRLTNDNKNTDTKGSVFLLYILRFRAQEKAFEWVLGR